jgi:hypothetical protein
MHRKTRQYSNAIETIDMAIRRAKEAPYLVLRALLAADTDNKEDHTAYLAMAFGVFASPDKLSDWQLGWFLTGAEELKDEERIGAAKAEQKRRRERKEPEQFPGAVLPAAREGLQLKMPFQQKKLLRLK